jgi:hypothetical protein
MSNAYLTDVKVRIGQAAKGEMLRIAKERELQLSDILREAVRFYLQSQKADDDATHPVQEAK